jgi:energy-converting hydrogenase Eha subunit H
MSDGDSRDAVPGDGRDETEAERLDRNWTELLQELRVTQTGTQILTGFLLTIPFQQRFTDLGPTQLAIYLVLVVFAVLATILALAPVSLHRALFRTGAKARIVRLANRLLIAALACVAVTLTGTTVLIFDVVAGVAFGIVAGVVTLVLCAAAWLLLPATTTRRRVHG